MNTYEEGLPYIDGSEDEVEAVSGAREVLRAEVVDGVQVGPYTAVVTLHRRRGAWLACATIETSAGPLRWCGVARDREVAERLVRAHQRRGGASAGIDFGALFQNLGRAVQQGTQQLARNRALRSTVRDIRRTLDTPALQPVLAVAQQIPYLGPAVTAFRAATTIVDDVLGGDPQTRNRLARIRQAAQQGNPTAREAMQVIETVFQSQQRITRQRAQGGSPQQRAQGGSPQQRSPGSEPARHRRPARRAPTPRPPSRPRQRAPSRSRQRAPSRPRHRGPSLREQQAWQRAQFQWGQRQRVAGRP